MSNYIYYNLKRKTVNNTEFYEYGSAIIPGTVQFILYSQTEKRKYRIYLYNPPAAAPKAGYPVLYVLDANAVFGTFVECMRAQMKKTEKTGIVPHVIVGIGYDTDDPFSPDRHYDLTLQVPLSELPANPEGKPWPKQGGADLFLTFIENELKPFIQKEIKIELKHQALFGHSLGGLFTLHTLFTKPQAFSTYIAGSPSIHWNRSVLSVEEENFFSYIKQNKLSINILLAAGELEKDHFSNMNKNARDMHQRLSFFESQGVNSKFYEFTDESHISVLPVLISKTLRFVSDHAEPTQGLGRN